MLFDYETLKLIWWLFIVVLLTGFAVMDGQDMGVGTLLPFLGKNDYERRIMINSVAPHWDGNQVWFITGGGAIFAAWPLIYATAFSGFYWAMLLLLFALFFRPVGFDYRSKLENTTWRNSWDWLLFVGSIVPPIICGVAFGNLLQGVPFYLDDNLRSFYTGSFFELLNPFALICGIVSLCMFINQGANYLVLKTTGNLQNRAKTCASWAGSLFIVLFVIAGFWVWFGLKGFAVTSVIDPNMFPNPLEKTVEFSEGAWIKNFQNYPVLWALPVCVVGGMILSITAVRMYKAGFAIIASSLSILATVLTPLSAMFPFLLPSSTHPNSSLTVWDCTSSHFTLELMLFVTLIFLPIVVFYTSWAYYTMRGKLTEETIQTNSKNLY